MTRPHPTVIEHLMIAGLRSEIVATFRHRHRRQEPCRCGLCDGGRVPEATLARADATGSAQLLSLPDPVEDGDE